MTLNTIFSVVLGASPQGSISVVDLGTHVTFKWDFMGSADNIFYSSLMESMT